jgi:hypothetical protein
VSARQAPRATGEGPHVLLSVGTGGGKASGAWAEVARLLAAEGRQVAVRAEVFRLLAAEGRQVAVMDGKAPHLRWARPVDETWEEVE